MKKRHSKNSIIIGFLIILIILCVISSIVSLIKDVSLDAIRPLLSIVSFWILISTIFQKEKLTKYIHQIVVKNKKFRGLFAMKNVENASSLIGKRVKVATFKNRFKGDLYEINDNWIKIKKSGSSKTILLQAHMVAEIKEK